MVSRPMVSYLRKANIGVDFTPLVGAFVRDTILPHGLDCMVEVDGKFLIIECKQSDERLSPGQQRSLQRLSRESNKRVFEVRLSGRLGDQGAHLFDPICFRRVLPNSFTEWESTNIDEFRNICAEWSGKPHAQLREAVRPNSLKVMCRLHRVFNCDCGWDQL
jgi:hypothetical protein